MGEAMRHPTEDQLRGLLAGEAPEDLVAHLEDCESCRSVAERLTEVPQDLWASLVVAAEAPPDHARACTPTIPGYEVFEELGRGGCGVVYRARREGTARDVAIKVLRSGALASPAEHAWFLKEARAASRLRHPNIVSALAVGAEADAPFYVMEYVANGSLADHLDGTPLPPGEAARLVEVVAGALSHAHASGLVHRDLKPGNILLDAPPGSGRSGVPRVADFGMAKQLAPGAGEGLTPTLAVFGTPDYMPPEQAFGRSREVGATADVYSLGAILYELLTGRPPFRGATPYETLLHVRDEEPVPPRRLRPGLPRTLESICLKCLEKDPAGRYETMAQLAADLAAFRGGTRVRARPLGRLGRFARWCRREPLAASLSAVILTLLAVLLVSVTVLWRGAEVRRAQAVDALVHQADVVSRLCAIPGNLRHTDRDIVVHAIEAFREAANVAGSDDEQDRVSYATLQFADALQNLGETDEAIRLAEGGVATLRRLAARHPEEPRLLYRYAQGCSFLSGCHESAGRLGPAMSHLRESIRVAEQIAPANPKRFGYLADLGAFRWKLAKYLVTQGRYAEAEPLVESSMAIAREIVARDPENAERYVSLNLALRTYADVGLALGRPSSRIQAVARELMAACETSRVRKDWHLFGPQLLPRDLVHPLQDAGLKDEAALYTDYAIRVWRELSDRTPAQVGVPVELARWLEVDAQRLWPTDPSAASRRLRQAIALLEPLVAEPQGQDGAFAELARILIECPDPALRDPARVTALLERARPDNMTPALAGAALVEAGRTAKGLEVLEAYVGARRDAPLQEEHTIGRLYYALALARSGHKQRAIAEFEAVRNPGAPPYRRSSAKINLIARLAPEILGTPATRPATTEERPAR